MNDHVHPHDHDHDHDHVHPHDHDHHHDHPRDHDHAPRGDDAISPGSAARIDRRTLLRVGGLGLGAVLLAACSSGGSPTASPTTGAAALTTLPGFDAFASTVKAFTDGDVWLVESDGMPAHRMMVGITSWQQQVPVPQPYTGANAWRFPAKPVLAAAPVSARTGLFRGAIAVAVNGVPIFNALNNRGDDAFLAGELDQWGGHAGRADDYHYHVAPLHLQDVVGATRPIAYALDGFAIYGAVEPDGSPVTTLDEYNGHIGRDGVYHYHGTTTYPYINGGLRGVVRVSDQVEPQPVTKAFRPAGAPLRGATIVAFDSAGSGSYRLEYRVNGQTARVDYQVDSTSVRFAFTDAVGAVRTETYAR